MRKLIISSIALLMSTAAVAAHESAPSPAVAALLDLEMQQESDGCRDGSGFVTLHPKTPCSLELMHKYQLQLQNLGWCQGKEGQPHYQWVWHKCGPDSLRVEENAPRGLSVKEQALQDFDDCATSENAPMMTECDAPIVFDRYKKYYCHERFDTSTIIFRTCRSESDSYIKLCHDMTGKSPDICRSDLVRLMFVNSMSRLSRQ